MVVMRIVETVIPNQQQIARLLLEPLYSIACSYELAYWVLWPVAKGHTVVDPFAPFFLLLFDRCLDFFPVFAAISFNFISTSPSNKVVKQFTEKQE